VKLIATRKNDKTVHVTEGTMYFQMALFGATPSSRTNEDGILGRRTAALRRSVGSLRPARSWCGTV